MKRILFIDDEQILLDGLRRTLRPLRPEWELEFESSPRAALARLDTEEFDVVVTDMRMPVIDGVAVLTEVMRRQPRAIRLVLSGYAELERSMRAVPLAHQFLHKPCDPDVLKAVIERISRMHERFRDPAMRSLLGSIPSLPVLPSVCIELSATLSRADFTVREVAAIAEKDPALSGKVLQVANSSFFGIGRRLTYVHDAVAYLGTSMLKQLVTVLSMFRALTPSDPSLRERQEQLFGHSQAVAAFAKRILQGNRTLADEAFVGGLLHEVGEILFMTHLGDRYLQAQGLAAAQGIGLHAAEQQILKVDHGEVGAYLLDSWGLPYPVLECAAYHHRAPELGHTSLQPVDAVYIANTILEARDEHAEVDERLETAYLTRLGVAKELAQWKAWDVATA